ncbi:MAG: hypothetical protein Q8S33_31490 [Myxococcales bacterium]|nr:hypothetical protein [Myxococcales bacterium]
MRTNRTTPTAAPVAPAKTQKAEPSTVPARAEEAPSKSRGWQPASLLRGARNAIKETAAQHGLFRVGMDNASPASNADATAYLTDKVQAKAHFDQRLEGAQKFLADRGMKGEVVAKLVTADIVNVGGMSPVEHAEWQFFLVPKAGGETWKSDSNGLLQRGASKTPPPGMLDEKKLTEWVQSQGVKSEGSAFLRSSDNPLFLGRLNYGTAGSGMYTKVPDYAEVGGHKYDTRQVEGLAVTTPGKVRAAIDAMYTKQPGAYSTNGVCHQGAVLVADALGLDPVKDAARHIDSLWASRLKFGRAGRELP